MSDEEYVRAKYPDAFAFPYAETWQIGSASYSFPPMPRRSQKIPHYLSRENCNTEAEAWADARQRIEKSDGK